MMSSGSTVRVGVVACAAALGLSACSKEPQAPPATTTTTETAAVPAAVEPTAAAPAAAAPAAAPAADNTDTLTGVKYASYTGDAAAGKTAFVTCQTCHAVEAGKNKIGPSLHAIVGRAAGTVPSYAYTPANKNSGITWTNEKLFQYLEKPQRVVPGTKMVFPGIPDPQKRADVIAYLASNT